MSTPGEHGNPLLDIEWEPCLLPPERDRELEALARHSMGTVPSSFYYFMPCPWLVRAHVRLNFSDGLLMHLDPNIAEIVSMAVSQEASCRYCYAVSRMLLRMQGMGESQVRKLEQQLNVATGDRRLDAAITFARRMSRSDPLVGRADKERLLATGYSLEQLREVAYVAAYTLATNRTATLPAVPPFEYEQLPDRWLMRAFRPLFAYLINRHDRRGKSTAAPQSEGLPFAYIIEAYAGSPIAHALSEVLADAWQSDILSCRCKILLFAVVARGLDCPLSLVECRRLLADEGIDDATLNDILDHLRSPQLNAVENALVPFARQTIWYRPVQVQRQARALLETVSREEFLEAIGILALANAFCRLGAAVIEH